MPEPDAILTRWSADAICGAFKAYREHFRAITARARFRFANRDWLGHQKDALDRLGLVSQVVQQVVMVLRAHLGAPVRDRALWGRMKELYSASVKDLPDRELAETFFNSVTRQIFATVGVDPAIEFVAPLAEPLTEGTAHVVWRREGGTEALLARILRSTDLGAPFEDLDWDVREGAARIDRHLASIGWAGGFDAVELARPVFYRGKAAYLVGRLRHGREIIPLALALRHPSPRGVQLDAVLFTDREIRILFSFARSYFHVDVERPRELVAFLRSVLPSKRLSELYISIGYHKHGKTELYRELLAFLSHTDARFERAEGDRGMVMMVFTLPPLDSVFKVIRDRFAPPKSTTRDEVKQKYGVAFRQDRAGRLVDAQEFEHLAFDADRFDPGLLEEILRECGETVRVRRGRVEIDHLFVQRRVHPLNLYVRATDADEARRAVLDYGQCIKDLAATNTFPGDMLLKNFGVTRSSRVIFYDYDELALVTDCRFREMPTARTDEDETRGEPWFYVGEHDIFPEEFLRFLGLPADVERAFLEKHGDLLTASYWRAIQERLSRGEIVDIYPYDDSRRLPRRARAAEPAPREEA